MKGLGPPKGRAPAESVKDTFRVDKPDTSMLSLRIESELHRRMKMQSVSEGRTMTEILEDLMRGYLDK